MAIVEKYVTHDASGGDGSSGSPWTLAEAAANASAGNRINVKAGAYTLSGAASVANDGSQSNAIMWRGFNRRPVSPPERVALHVRRQGNSHGHDRHC